MKIEFAEAMELATELLVRVGHSEYRAAAVARALSLADAWGLASHGFLRLPVYLDRCEAGGYDPAADLRTVADLGALIVLDGGTGLGHWQLADALQMAQPRARQYGVAAVAIGNSGHCGALGVYAADAAEAGFAALIFSNGPAVLPPWDGHERLLSTSPIAAGFPNGRPPAVVDLALSTVARGKVAAYASRGEELPEGWALDANGNPTTDPHEGLHGMLSPLGGAKGFALAYLVESLTAGLVGPCLSREMPDFFDNGTKTDAQGISHLMVLFDPQATDAQGDRRGAQARLERLAAATGEAGGRVPGARRLPPSEVGPGHFLDVETTVLEGLLARRSGVTAP